MFASELSSNDPVVYKSIPTSCGLSTVEVKPLLTASALPLLVSLALIRSSLVCRAGAKENCSSQEPQQSDHTKTVADPPRSVPPQPLPTQDGQLAGSLGLKAGCQGTLEGSSQYSRGESRGFNPTVTS